jgi:soluble lytic murein transglycosylase-like protein
VALACVLFAAACATQAEVRREPAPAAGGDALYDSASEWADANRLPPLPARRRAPRRLVRLEYAFEPEYEMHVLNASVLARSRSVQPIVWSASRKHAVAADLVNGIIWTESRFQVYARSSKGACGLMQLMPRTGREVARAIGMSYDPWDPEFNIHAGTYYFARMVDRFAGDLTLALAAYNIGPARVDGWVRLSQPLPGRSRAYVYNVFNAARAFRQHEL